MALLSILCTLLLEQIRGLEVKGRLNELFLRYADLLFRNFNAGERRHGTLAWLAAVVPWFVAAQGLYLIADGLGSLVALAWCVVVLYATVGLGHFNRTITGIQDALNGNRLEDARGILRGWGEHETLDYSVQELVRVTIERGLLVAHRRVFGVLTWFLLVPALFGTLVPGALFGLLLGPGGAVLYVLAGILDERWGDGASDPQDQFGRFSRDAFAVLDWLPSRITALSFAIVGDFEDALYCWRAQSAAWPDSRQGIVLASGAGALGVRLGDSVHRNGTLLFRPELGLGDEADIEYMNSAVGLVWRTLVLWMLVIALMTVASWVS